jgi:hypothetical protein
MENVAQINIAPRIDWKKIGQDLTILRAFKDFTNKNGWRAVVSGGYGLDLYLNITTRTHGDIDLIIYGKFNKEEASVKVIEFIKGLFSDAQTALKPEEYYLVCDVKAEGFGANIYLVETTEDPYTNINKIVKSDGQVIENNYEKFPKPLLGHMGKFEIEIQDQNAHLADILIRSGQNTIDAKYKQDIENLKHITDPSKVESIKNHNG